VDHTDPAPPEEPDDLEPAEAGAGAERPGARGRAAHDLAKDGIQAVLRASLPEGLGSITSDDTPSVV
jgi:hypothetical protein